LRAAQKVLRDPKAVCPVTAGFQCCNRAITINKINDAQDPMLDASIMPNVRATDNAKRRGGSRGCSDITASV
jgi:hypothetical protein